TDSCFGTRLAGSRYSHSQATTCTVTPDGDLARIDVVKTGVIDNMSQATHDVFEHIVYAAGTEPISDFDSGVSALQGTAASWSTDVSRTSVGTTILTRLTVLLW